MSDHVKICQYVRCSNILTGKQEKWCFKQCAKSQKKRDKRKPGESLEICANAQCNNHLTGRQRKYCSKRCNAHQWLLDNPRGYPKCGIRWCERDTSHGGFGYCTRHYDSLRKHGNPLQVEINEILVETRNRLFENRVKGANARARKLGLPGRITESDLEEILHTLKGRCFYCGVDLKGVFETDHMTPFCRGGANDKDNITFACQRCHRDKGTKTAEEFLATSSILR